MGTSVTHSVTVSWKSLYESLNEPGLLGLGWLGRETVRFVTHRLASCRVQSDVEKVLAHTGLVEPWK